MTVRSFAAGVLLVGLAGCAAPGSPAGTLSGAESAAACIARAASEPSIKLYRVPNTGVPWGIAPGPDQALWVADRAGARIWHVTTGGKFTQSITLSGSYPRPQGLVWTHPNRLWFTENGVNKVGEWINNGRLSEYNLANSRPEWAAKGPKDSAWFTLSASDQVLEITSQSSLAYFKIPTASSGANRITGASGGAIWFTEAQANKIGRVLDGKITEYEIPAKNSLPQGITQGPDGAIWFAERDAKKIGRIDNEGHITEYGVHGGGAPEAIVTGPDGALWFSEYGADVGRITTDGTITLYRIPSGDSRSEAITLGSDGALWFTAYSPTAPVAGYVERLEPAPAARACRERRADSSRV